MNKAVIAFGRFNPVSIGHVKLAKAIQDKAEELDAEPFVYLSKSYDGVDSPKYKKGKEIKNPLPYDKKVQFVEDAIGHIVGYYDGNTLYDILHELYKIDRYSEVYIYGGDDRKAEWDRVKSYNGKESNPKYFKFDKIEVLSAGAREGDTDEENASASLLRQCVKDLDYDKFARFAGTKTLTEEMFDELIYQLGVEVQ